MLESFGIPNSSGIRITRFALDKNRNLIIYLSDGSCHNIGQIEETSESPDDYQWEPI